MNCDLMNTMIEPLVDGELDANQRARVLEHLETCPECQAQRRRLETLHANFRAGSQYHRAPDTLRHRVMEQTRSRAAGTWKWLAVAAGLLLAVSLGTNFVLLRSGQSSLQAANDEIFSSHARSLLGAHLIDVPSSDSHTVKPWFTGKLDFSPSVRDLAHEGFPLAGGRLDYLGGRPVAALVFRHGQHVINLFTWPVPDTAPQNSERVESSARGYHLVAWTEAGMVYRAVSDVNMDALRKFVSLI